MFEVNIVKLLAKGKMVTLVWMPMLLTWLWSMQLKS